MVERSFKLCRAVSVTCFVWSLFSLDTASDFSLHWRPGSPFLLKWKMETIMPERIQLSRKRGFCLQRVSRAINGLGAVKVDRATQWGNPFVSHSPEFNRIAVRLFEEHLRTSGIFLRIVTLREELSSKT